jgi:hypothetical protein
VFGYHFIVMKLYWSKRRRKSGNGNGELSVSKKIFASLHVGSDPHLLNQQS